MRLILFVAGILLAIGSSAQPDTKDGYRFDFTVNGLRDTVVYLGYYYGESTYLRDTAQVDSGGKGYFSGAEKLPQGMYFLILDKTRLFDMAVGDDQRFAMYTDTSDYVGNMKVEGSEDNRILYESMLFNAAHHQQAKPFTDVLQDSLAADKEKDKARERLAKIDKEVMDYQDQLMEQYPTTLTVRWLRATRPITVPDSIGRGASDSLRALARYRYYRDHFFDNMELTDDALLRLPTPLYSNKLLEYLDDVMPSDPDSIFNAIKRLAKKTETHQETYKYLVWTALSHYQAPKYMGLDRVYVDLYDYYFASGKMDFWVGEGVKKNIREQADRFRLSLVGNRGANLIMQDQNLNLRSLYDLKNRYVIIFFFDPDCGHCRTETPKLVDFYNEYKKKFDLEVYAVSSDTSMQKMKDYIESLEMPWITVNGPRTTVGPYNELYDVFTTPTLYVLDRQKKIIAKKPPIEILPDFLAHHERIRAKKEKEEATGTM